MDEDVPPNEDDVENVGASASGDAFELSQLLFVVGHVAIKQIVYLELVEREWKRQKDEKEKGTTFHLHNKHKLIFVPPLFSGKECKVDGRLEFKREGRRRTRASRWQRRR